MRCKLSLRKEKLNKIILSKRKLEQAFEKNRSKYQVNLDELQIESDIKEKAVDLIENVSNLSI